METDLFGVKLTPAGLPPLPYSKRTRRGKPNGYAAAPGLGPAGESCKTCAHLCYFGRFKKCGRMRAVWTRGNATDIRAKTPACQLWEPNAQPSGR